MPARVYANLGYLAEMPENERVFIGSEGPMAGSPEQRVIERITAGTDFSIRAGDAEIQLALAAGGGIAIMPDFMT